MQTDNEKVGKAWEKEAIELGWKDGPRAPGSTAGETAYLCINYKPSFLKV